MNTRITRVRAPLAACVVIALLLAGCGKNDDITLNNDGCLHYATQVSLNGMAKKQDVTAPGKMTRVALMLNLDQPVCVSAASSASAGTYKKVENLKQIELVAQSDITTMHQLDGYRVTAKGSLTNISGDGAISPVGMTVIHIKPENQ